MSVNNTKKSKAKFDLGSNNVRKTFLTILIPTLVAQLIAGTYIIFDTMFIAHGFHPGPIFQGIGDLSNESDSYSSLGIAAVSYALPYTFFIIGIGITVGAGLATIMTKQMTKGDFTGEQKSMNTFMPLCIMWGGAATIFLLISAKVLVWMGSGFQVDYLESWFSNPLMDPEWSISSEQITSVTYKYINGHILSQAAWFLRIQAIGAIPFVYISAGVIMLRVQGKAQYATSFSTVGLIINILFDFLFIIVLKMNVIGAAIATVIGQSVNALIYWYYFKYKANIKSTKMEWKHAFGITKDVWVSGMSIMMLQIITGIVLITFTISIGIVNYGSMYIVTNYTSVYQGYNSLFVFANLIIIAIAQSMKPIVEYNYLKDNKENVRKARKMGYGIGMIFSIVATIFICLFGEKIIGLFYSVNGDSVDLLTSAFFTANPDQAFNVFGDLWSYGDQIFTNGMEIAKMIVIILFVSFPIATAISLSGAYIQALGNNKKTFILLFGKISLLFPIIILLGFGIPAFITPDWEFTINQSETVYQEANLNIFLALPITDVLIGSILIYFLLHIEKNIYNKIPIKKVAAA